MDLCNPREVRALLERYGLAPQKGFGQNFLINPDIPERIAESSYNAVRSRPCAALEIGPGIGALTSSLCERFDRVVAVEIDRGLLPLLDETLGDYDNVTVVSADFMTIDVAEFFREHFSGYDVSVCANLPYYITTPIIMKLFESFPVSEAMPISSMTFMVQLEVADRICSTESAGDNGSVTAAIGLSAKAEKLFTVAAVNFYPAPSVKSAVMRFIPHKNGLYSIYLDAPTDHAECERFAANVKKVIAAAFAHRRKTLANSLAGIYSKEKTSSALEQCGFRPDIRGECLSSADFCRLTDILEKTD